MTTFEIDSQDFLLFMDRALDGMVAILEELGDELANSEPNLPGANSPTPYFSTASELRTTG